MQYHVQNPARIHFILKTQTRTMNLTHLTLAGNTQNGNRPTVIHASMAVWLQNQGYLTEFVSTIFNGFNVLPDSPIYTGMIKYYHNGFQPYQPL